MSSRYLCSCVGLCKDEGDDLYIAHSSRLNWWVQSWTIVLAESPQEAAENYARDQEKWNYPYVEVRHPDLCDLLYGPGEIYKVIVKRISQSRPISVAKDTWSREYLDRIEGL